METNVILNINDVEYTARLTYDFTKGYAACFDEPAMSDDWDLQELHILHDDEYGNETVQDVSFLIDSLADNLIAQVLEG